MTKIADLSPSRASTLWRAHGLNRGTAAGRLGAGWLAPARERAWHCCGKARAGVRL